MKTNYSVKRTESKAWLAINTGMEGAFVAMRKRARGVAHQCPHCGAKEASTIKMENVYTTACCEKNTHSNTVLCLAQANWRTASQA